MAKLTKQKHWWAIKILEKWETANPNGRPISFKNEFKKLLDADWSLKIAKENILSINDDWSVTLKVAKKDAMVMKALWWAMSNKGTESTKMLVWIMEMFDWKAVQKGEIEHSWTIKNDYSNLSTEELLKLKLWQNKN